MGTLTIRYWRDMPALVLAKAGRRNKATAPLPERFEKAIDAAAMRGGLDSTDDYLSEWRDGEGVECGDDLQAAADAKAAELDALYGSDTLKALIANAGRQPQSA